MPLPRATVKLPSGVFNTSRTQAVVRLRQPKALAHTLDVVRSPTLPRCFAAKSARTPAPTMPTAVAVESLYASLLGLDLHGGVHNV